MSIRIDELSKDLKKARKRLSSNLDKIMKESARSMEERARSRVFSRFDDQSGDLRRSIKAKYRRVGGLPTVTLKAGGGSGSKNLKYAISIEEGTRDIRARHFIKRSGDKERERLGPILDKLLSDALGV